MNKIKLRACHLTTRMYDGIPEAIFENGTEPIYVIGKNELAVVIKTIISLYRYACKYQKDSDIAVLPDFEEAHGLVDLKTVERITRLSKSTIYNLLRAKKFPPPIKLTRRTVRWKSIDIDNWIKDKNSTNDVTPKATPQDADGTAEDNTDVGDGSPDLEDRLDQAPGDAS